VSTLVTTNDPLEFTPEQRFFIAAATVWRGKIRDEALVTRVRSGVHAPPEVRATQPLRNTDEFYDAFGIVEGDPMYLAPSERISIW
jgi:putative endopeptidase